MLHFRGLSMPLLCYIIRNLFVHRSQWDTCTCAHSTPKRGQSDLLATGRSVHPPGRPVTPATLHTVQPERFTISLVFCVLHDASEVKWLWCSSLEADRIPVPESKVIIHFWSHFSTYYITRLKRLLCPSLGPMHQDNYKSKPCISVIRLPWNKAQPSLLT